MTRHRLEAIVALALALPALAGCPSYLVAQSPRTVAPGHIETSASVSDLVHFGGTVAGTPIPAATEEPGASASLRIGLTDFADLGLHVHSSDVGVGADLKLRFVHTARFQAAVAPGIETSLIWPLAGALSSLLPKNQVVLKGFVYTLHLPVLFGFTLEGGPMVFFGPKMVITNWQMSAFLPKQGQTESVGSLSYQPGLVVGAEVRMGNGLRMIPEIDLHYDVGTQALFLAVGITGVRGG